MNKAGSKGDIKRSAFDKHLPIVIDDIKPSTSIGRPRVELDFSQPLGLRWRAAKTP